MHREVGQAQFSLAGCGQSCADLSDGTQDTRLPENARGQHRLDPRSPFWPLSCYIVTQFWARSPCRPGTQLNVGTVSTHRLGDPGQRSRAPVTCVTLKC